MGGEAGATFPGELPTFLTPHSESAARACEVCRATAPVWIKVPSCTLAWGCLTASLLPLADYFLCPLLPGRWAGSPPGWQEKWLVLEQTSVCS